MRVALDLTFQSPKDLLAEAHQEMAAVTQERLFNSPHLKKTQEKWCAAMFGIGYEKFVSPCRVAINATKHRLDADFFLEAPGKEFPFQIVEVMEPGRRRGAEFKAGAVKRISYDPNIGRAHGPQWIARKLEQKVAKKYANAGSMNLLLYSNFPGQVFNTPMWSQPRRNSKTNLRRHGF
jgi:hypothetical protein